MNQSDNFSVQRKDEFEVTNLEDLCADMQIKINYEIAIHVIMIHQVNLTKPPAFCYHFIENCFLLITLNHVKMST